MGGYFKKEAVISIYVILSFQNTVFGGEICDGNPLPQGLPLPQMPQFFSTNIQVNEKGKNATAEIIRIVDTTTKRESVEVWSSSTHLKYISIASEDALLSIKYGDNGPTCKKSDLSKTSRRSVYNADNAWPLDILDVIETKILTQSERFTSAERDYINGIHGLYWVFCDDVPDLDAEVKISLFFSLSGWKPSYANVKQNEYEIVQLHIEGMKTNREEIDLTMTFYNYKPLQPSEENFQIPEQVHCVGYRTDKKLPDLPKYFSYESEKLQYGSSPEVSPVISHRSVYYDTKNRLALVIFENPDNKDDNLASEISIIYDFNLGVQYSTDPDTGGCVMDTYNKTFDAISAIKTATNSILDPKEFFWLDGSSISYSGKYQARGIVTDVFSGLVTKNNDRRVCFWYFSTDNTKITEGQEVEKNVLVKMVSRPVSGNGKQDQTELNFYNFIQAEPSDAVFDITPCYNESQSKSFVLTFSGTENLSLKESQLLLKREMHQAIQKTAVVSQQRVSIDQLYFRGAYLYVEFTLLDLPPILGQKPLPNESNLQTAIGKLQESVSKRTFKVSFTTKAKGEIILEPPTDGLKEFKGERKTEASGPTYKEGSVVGVSIGMTILGFLLGAVVVNLIINKKYGVSLFQKAGYLGKGANAFNNPLNESSM